MSRAVNLFDFDHTIYDGDASLDFILYVTRRNPRTWRHYPLMAFSLVLYVFGLKSRKEIKQVAFRFLNDIDDIERELAGFWRIHQKNIKTWYKEIQQPDDVLISASPDFLLRPIAEQLSVGTLIATKMDKSTGEIKGKNCRAEEKTRRLYDTLPNVKVRAVYSDSLSDTPILKLGEGYIVKKNVMIPFEEYTPSRAKQFASPEFIRFLFVGGLNALIGICFATITALFVESTQVAFIIGFTVSLIPSYFLNSVITFRDKKFSLSKFGRFVVSYIPNFLIQLVIVHGVTEWLNVPPVITYTISVVIAVPITFVLLRLLTFKRGGNNENK